MCLAFFRGKGYSDKFTEHMRKMKGVLAKNPVVKVAATTDDICSHCPNNIEGECEKPDKVAGYDRKVLELCGLDAGTEIQWKEFEGLVWSCILRRGIREDICGDCQWSALCYLTESKKSDR